MAQARDWRGRFASGGGGGWSVGMTGTAKGGTRTTVVGKLPRKGVELQTPGGQRGRFYATKKEAILVSRVHRDGSTSVPGRFVGGNLAARKIGSPIGGNKNLRYASRTNVIASSTGWLSPGLRGVGRYTSRRGAIALNTPGSAPRSGYVVARGPRVGK